MIKSEFLTVARLWCDTDMEPRFSRSNHTLVRLSGSRRGGFRYACHSRPSVGSHGVPKSDGLFKQLPQALQKHVNSPPAVIGLLVLEVTYSKSPWSKLRAGIWKGIKNSWQNRSAFRARDAPNRSSILRSTF